VAKPRPDARPVCGDRTRVGGSRSLGIDSSTAPLGSGQVVRQLTLDQPIRGSNPLSPATCATVDAVRGRSIWLHEFGKSAADLSCQHKSRACVTRQEAVAK